MLLATGSKEQTAGCELTQGRSLVDLRSRCWEDERRAILVLLLEVTRLYVYKCKQLVILSRGEMIQQPDPEHVTVNG